MQQTRQRRYLLLLVALPFVVDGLMVLALAQAGPAFGVPPAPVSFAVFFDWDQASLSVHARETLAKASQAARSGSPARLAMLADDSPVGRLYGQRLTRARWRSIAAELQRDGIAPNQVVHVTADRATVLPQPIAGLVDDRSLLLSVRKDVLF